MKWRKVTVAFLVVMLLLGAAVGCSKPATPTPVPATPTQAVSPTPTPAAVKPITLKFGAWVSATAAFGKAQDWYLSQVENRSGGRIKFERYWSGSLAPADQLLDALSSGIADVATVMPTYYPSKLPLGTVGSLAYESGATKDIWTAFTAYTDLYSQTPALQQELAKYHTRFLAPAGTSPYYLISRREIKSIADLKGLKARALDQEATLLSSLGGVPVNMAAPELFDALQRGTIDGVVFSPSGVTAYGLQDAAKFFWQLPMGGQVFFLGIRDAAWNSIPSDLQKLMSDVAKEVPKSYEQIYQIDGDGASLAKMKAAGVAVSAPSADDIAKVEAAIPNAVKVWEDDLSSKGLPGKEVYDTYVSLLKKYEPSNPFKK